MRLDNFDLNLLVAFNVLLEERSVTRSAERLHVTQSAMSASLKRLREAFQDDLLVQSGRTMVPTPNAMLLAPKVSEAIVTLRSLISAGTGFDPATSQRRFRIAASDYITTVLLVPLMRLLETEAPGIGFEISLPTEDTPDRLAKGEFDLVLTPLEFLDPVHPADLLFEERHVVVGCKDNPLLASPMSPAQFAEAPHVAVTIDGRDTFIEGALDHQGLTRRIEIRAPSFVLVPQFLHGTARIALMHERLARLMAPSLSLAIAEPPFTIMPMREMVQYHATRSQDAGLTWMRGKLGDLARTE
ncbi:LysR family transcriptional regulator [Altererythrobacter salegens]|uniref:LysR family transcriptional regulator n=1 Tax=Croceibacterium salegens TaxID=1737568 RepID=A0A6I4T126_9SPHN|nr:LysR family transcriptional regulator [Croceibacterium salegens]MXO60986.1 LysR family transcriptional regulator [Croceibacterium salegens]